MTRQRSAQCSLCGRRGGVLRMDYDIGPGSRPGSPRRFSREIIDDGAPAEKTSLDDELLKDLGPDPTIDGETNRVPQRSKSKSPKDPSADAPRSQSCSRGSATAKILACRVKTIRWRS